MTGQATTQKTQPHSQSHIEVVFFVISSLSLLPKNNIKEKTENIQQFVHTPHVSREGADRTNSALSQCCTSCTSACVLRLPPSPSGVSLCVLYVCTPRPWWAHTPSARLDGAHTRPLSVHANVMSSSASLLTTAHVVFLCGCAWTRLSWSQLGGLLRSAQHCRARHTLVHTASHVSAYGQVSRTCLPSPSPVPLVVCLSFAHAQ